MAHPLTNNLETVDLVVVGAGAAGMTAALVAAHEGLRVVLCESTQQVGGTTATSAGTLWIPGNRHGREAGYEDCVDHAARYLEALSGLDDERDRRRAFLQTGDEAVAWLEAHTQVAFTSSGVHPDYLVRVGAADAGRALSPAPFDGRQLGKPDFRRIRPPIPEFLVLGGMMVGKADVQSLVGRWSSAKSFFRSAHLLTRYFLDRLRYPRGTRLVMGNALVARLFASARDKKIDVRFGWRLCKLIQEEGQVVGAVFDTSDGKSSIHSVRGVVLATGGVGHSGALREELLGIHSSIPTLACESVTGEGIQVARLVGGKLERHAHGDFFWQPVSRVPWPERRHGLFPHLFMDRAKPGLVAVDTLGRRFVNEASSYHHFVEGMRAHAANTGRDSVWFVCDAVFVQRYGLGVIPPGTVCLRGWVKSGYVTVGDSLESLSVQTGIDLAGLTTTISEANRAAITGIDIAYAKGQSSLDRFNGDASHAPNPCLGSIATSPFVALRVLAADAASSAGLATDADGRVLTGNDAPIVGLYACGNDAASVMVGTYPGPGATLGPALVFAYRVARHAARKS